MAIMNWMCWEGGVDLVAVTRPGLTMPNVIVHVARMVHTPDWSSAAGMVFYQPDPNAAPLVVGFVSENEMVGKYFGPRIFTGTPFEQAPVLMAKIEISINLPQSVGAKVTIGQQVFETKLWDLDPAIMVNRSPNPNAPFTSQGVEARAKKASLKVNGEEVAITIAPAAPSGGPGAVWAPCGIYAR